MKNQTLDLAIIGGGIMGLMTAYYASQFGKKIVIFEKRFIGNKEAASFSLTRSFRNDYLDPFYSRLAREAQILWKDIQKDSEKDFLISCGCLNLANTRVTKDLKNTYAEKSFENISSLGFKTEKFSKSALQKRFPQFKANMATLDEEAGFVYLPEVTKTLLKILKKRNVEIIENCTIKNIKEDKNGIQIVSNSGKFKAKNAVITSGIWTNETLKLIPGYTLQFPITKDKPQQCKYYIPRKNKQMFTPNTLPVFAYLDVGIYGHPWYIGKTPGVKIGFYNPPDFEIKKSKIKSIEDFVNTCMPTLKNSQVEDVTDVDQCFYQMVQDDEFILGKLPKSQNIYVGCGWRGTGYKFAPLIGKILAQIALQKGTVYDISRFSPERFSKM